MKKDRKDRFTYGDGDEVTIYSPSGKKVTPGKKGKPDKDEEKSPKGKRKKGSVDLSPVERVALIRLASTLQPGTLARRAILAALTESD